LLPLCFRRWRALAYARTVRIALLVALPWLTLWPAALWLRSPDSAAKRPGEGL